MTRFYRCLQLLFVLSPLLLFSLLVGCGALTSGALPPSPTPFPTLARLPTVTPDETLPTPLPAVPYPSPTLAVTPTLPIVEATVLFGANMREGPGLDYTIIGNVTEAESVTLLGQRNGWYKIVAADGTEGWMSAEVLDVTSDMAASVPIIEP